jgi:LuxR family maltose regulon positive regulatory protein
MVLQWTAKRMSGEGAERLLGEIEDTASANGLARLLRDLKPAASAQARDAPRAAAPALALRPAPARPPEAQAFVVQSGLLTAKECAVLALLARNYSNKEIARALDVGPTTVKWHLRNLFGKLNVGGRRHAVQRARMLQLVAPEEIVQ